MITSHLVTVRIRFRVTRRCRAAELTRAFHILKRPADPRKKRGNRGLPEK